MEFKATVAGSVADLPCFAPSQAEMTPFTASTAGLERGNLGVGRTPAQGSMPQGRGSAEVERAEELGPWTGQGHGDSPRGNCT